MKRLIFLVCILIAGIVWIHLVRMTASPDAPGRLASSGETSPSPTPFPFQEMTVPYLRTRPYASALGRLMPSGGNAAYTSYVTSYVSDGLTIYGLLTRPTGDMPEGGWPAILFVHGYIPPAQYRTTQNYVSYVDSLARNGFVVFKIDLRGHDKSEGTPGGAYYSSDYVIDTLNARAALSSSDFVNPKKIGLWGHSMAGNVLMRSFVAQPDIPAVVIWAGAGYTYTDLMTYRISDTSYRAPANNTQRQQTRQRLHDTYGEFDPSHAFWKQVAVTEYLSDLKGALQIHHAVDDAVVSVEYSRNLISHLRGKPVIYELFEYETGGHNLSGNSYTQAMSRTVEFFRTHLAGIRPLSSDR